MLVNDIVYGAIYLEVIDRRISTVAKADGEKDDSLTRVNNFSTGTSNIDGPVCGL